jgi:hypothetical protein
MFYGLSSYSDSRGYGRLSVPVLLTGRAPGFRRIVLSLLTYFTVLLTHRAAFQAAAISSIFTMFGVAGAAAQTQQPSEYERGIWYDISGIGKDSLGPVNNEVEKLYNQGVRRVHIMVNENISQKAIHCDCIHDNDKVSYFTYRNLNPDVKSAIAKEYHSCLKQEEDTNKWCANADNYAFEFDKWGGFERAKRGRRVVWRSKFYRLGLLIDQLNKRNIHVIITIWPEPNSQYINSLSNLTNYIVSSKHSIYGVELEDEENWSEVFTQDGTKQELDEAAGNLVAKLRHDLPSMKIGVTAAGRGGFVRGKFINDKLLTNRDVDFISFQAYQDVGKVCNPSKISGDSSPSSLATKAIELVSSTDKLNKKNFILGLSAFQLDCSQTPNPTGVNGTVNMYVAAKTSICAAEQHSIGPKAKIMGDSYFSEANIVTQRDKGNFYAHNFLSLCQIDSIKTHCGEPTAVADNSGASETLLLSELNRDCPNIISDLTNKVAVTPGQPPAGNREIYIRRRLSQ